MNAQLTVRSNGEHRAASWWPDWRLIQAEVLKLRKQRGLIVAALALSAGAVILAYSILAILHATDPENHGPAGGLANFQNAMFILSRFGVAAAILVGAYAGAGDLAAGVFRSLVVTGRSRVALFAARIPGGLAVLLPIFALATALATGGAFLLAGSLPTPSLGLIVRSGLWIELDMTVVYFLALGLASLLGSRTTTIAVLIPIQIVLTQMLLNLQGLTWLRSLFPGVAVSQLAPAGLASLATSTDIAMSLGAIVVVIIGWSVAALAAGAWRTATQDA